MKCFKFIFCVYSTLFYPYCLQAQQEYSGTASVKGNPTCISYNSLSEYNQLIWHGYDVNYNGNASQCQRALFDADYSYGLPLTIIEYPQVMQQIKQNILEEYALGFANFSIELHSKMSTITFDLQNLESFRVGFKIQHSVFLRFCNVDIIGSAKLDRHLQSPNARVSEVNLRDIRVICPAF